MPSSIARLDDGPGASAINADGTPSALARTATATAEAPVSRRAATQSAATVVGQDHVEEDSDSSWLQTAVKATKTDTFGALKTAADMNSAIGVNGWGRAAHGIEIASRRAHALTRPVATARGALAGARAANETLDVMKSQSQLLRTSDALGNAGAVLGVVGAAAEVADELHLHGRFTGKAGLAVADGVIGVAGTYMGPVVSAGAMGWSIGRAIDNASGLSDKLSDALVTDVKTDLRGTYDNAADKLGSNSDMNDLIERFATGKATNSDRGAVTTLLNEARLAGVLREDGTIDKDKARDIMGWWKDDDLVEALERAQIASHFLPETP